MTALLEIQGLRVAYGPLVALEHVSLGLQSGETLGVIEESGSGKTTLARAILRQVDASAGRICIDGHDVTRLRGGAPRRSRRDFGVVFQDPMPASTRG